MTSYGQNESYSQGYASGLDHSHSDSFTCNPSGSHKQQCTGLHSGPVVDRKSNSDEQTPNYVHMYPRKIHNHPSVQQPNSCRQLYLDNDQFTHQNSHSQGLPRVYGNDIRHAFDSSYADESETELSDEEKEYVYYVNRPTNQTASHV